MNDEIDLIEIKEQSITDTHHNTKSRTSISPH